MFTGAFTSAQSALAGSAAFSIYLTAAAAASRGRVGIEAMIEPDPFLGLPSLVVTFLIIMLPAIAFSFPPALVGGVFLAYRYRRDASHGQLTARGAVRLGAFVGGLAGVALSLFVALIIVWLGMNLAHRLPPLPFAYTIPYAIRWVAPIAVIATLAGAWTGRRLATPYAKVHPAA